jgi:hypothetical protein
MRGTVVESGTGERGRLSGDEISISRYCRWEGEGIAL